MLVTEDFVFVHIPKTGGTFIQEIVRDHLPMLEVEALIGAPAWSHTPFGALPERFRRLPSFCIVRNPWDWYVSWFHYQRTRGPRRRRSSSGGDPWGKLALWEGPFRSGTASFKEAVTAACSGAFQHRLSPVIREKRIDLYSAWVMEILGDALDRPNFTVLKFERGLRKPLLRFLRTHTDVPPGLVSAVRRQPPRLRSVHGPYIDYYDDELRELVGDRARWLCERFDYAFAAPVKRNRPVPAPRRTPAARDARAL